MKQNYNSKRYLAQDPCSALKEISKGQFLVTQLQAMVLPALQLQADERCELVAQMFETILDCSRKAMSELHLQFSDDREDDALQLQVDDKRRVRKISSSDGSCTSKDMTISKPHRQQKRRRLGESVSLETPVPHYDGHQWRKYGQKIINKAKHPRSYYRCTYREEEKCKATKTVQQQQDCRTGAAVTDLQDHHPVMYTVVYSSQHTCCKQGAPAAAADDHAIIETAAAFVSTESPESSNDQQQVAHMSDSSQQGSSGGISVTCSSLQLQDSRNQLMLDMLQADDEDLTMDNYCDLVFDMTAPLDLYSTPTHWEMNAHPHNYGFQKFGC